MTTQEIVAQGKLLYEQTIRTQVEVGNEGKYLAIDIESGEYLLVETHEEFIHRLFAQGPKAERYLMRIGSPVYLYRGSGRIKEK